MICSDVRKTKQIANTRIHVERAIERIKRFKFLTQQIQLQTLSNFDDIVLVCSALVNMDKPLVK